MTILTIPCPRCAWTGSTENELATHHLDMHERPWPEEARALYGNGDRWRHRNGSSAEEPQP